MNENFDPEFDPTLDALIAFRVEDAGDHTVVLDYHPDIVYFGLALSLLFLALFLLTLLALRLRPVRRLLYGPAETIAPAPWSFDGEDAIYDDPTDPPEGTEPLTLKVCIGRVAGALRARRKTPAEPAEPFAGEESAESAPEEPRPTDTEHEKE